MLNSLIKSIAKVFGGNKSERDVQQLLPVVAKVNEWFNEYNALSHDQLRAKTIELKQRISDGLADIDAQIDAIKSEIEKLTADDVIEKDELYSDIEKLEKDRDVQLEKILLDILPEAFAVVKQTAKRFSENETLEVTASPFDVQVSKSKPNVRISGDKAYYANEWTAAGGVVKWNMVHYDVQLIGGMVLHQGKISEMGTGEGKTLVSTLYS